MHNSSKFLVFIPSKSTTKIASGFTKYKVLKQQKMPCTRPILSAGNVQRNFSETEMKKLKSGDFKVTLKLHKDREYRFRYLIDSNRWENDWHADQYVPNTFGCDDSLVIV